MDFMPPRTTTARRRHLLASAVGMACAVCLAGPAAAQAPAKPAAAKTAAAKPAAAKPVDNLLSKEELRACMKQKADIDARKADIAQRSEQLKKDRELVSQPDPAIVKMRADVDAQLARVREADAAVKANAELVNDWNERMATFEATKKEMRNADRRGNVLRQERIELERETKRLEQARSEQVAIYDDLINKANGMRGGEDRAAAWNKRNDALADEADALIDVQANYSADCANRRFREDDEAAIKAGK